MTEWKNLCDGAPEWSEETRLNSTPGYSSQLGETSQQIISDSRRSMNEHHRMFYKQKVVNSEHLSHGPERYTINQRHNVQCGGKPEFRLTHSLLVPSLDSSTAPMG